MSAGAPRSRLAAATAYSRPAPAGEGLLRLDGNEGATPPASLLGELASAGPDLLRLYPDTAPLEALLAARFGVDPSRVLVTAGADDVLDRACRAFLGPGREIVLPSPSFEMIERYALLAEGVVRRVPWPDGAWPREAALAALTAATGVVAIVSPNNPTGAVASGEDVRALALASPGALVLLDHAYVEYADRDLTREALAFPNVVVARTFSKAWGLAGCRVGHALGSPEAIALLRRAGAPYPVAAPSLALAAARLARGGADVAAHVRVVRRQREALAALLLALGLPSRPSQANFVLVDAGPLAPALAAALLAQGVVVRAFPHLPELRGSLRITLPGTELGERRLHGALAAALPPAAGTADVRP